ncbi:nucleotidyltransferase family protein [Flavisolibacter ginsenosidimutans]|uniref:DNA polymerase subunit beta n=1 Tax=Flavisolibacter ginsenosidimutans TaxID=661481 RepID=A0A5B8ULB5_9BACT|nr:nucleotidyltransferase domain-containing protein [Flavisolibacter ginsenosidimutans]QEC57236.1 DNA polymerase subunit beta [Flavisolibacter ginsenosidimutans]
MDKATILSELKRVKPDLAQRYGLTELALFGSYSRGEQTAQSDIDLMVDFEKPHFNKFFDCVFMLKDLFKEKEVQVVSKGGIKPQYFQAIKPDLLYA